MIAVAAARLTVCWSQGWHLLCHELSETYQVTQILFTDTQIHCYTHSMVALIAMFVQLLLANLHCPGSSIVVEGGSFPHYII